jgi:hypothetical protein
MNYDRAFAYTYGVILVLIGLCAFVPPFLSPMATGPSDVAASAHVIPVLSGNLMHSFHFNIVLSVFYLAMGGLGFWMAAKPVPAHRYAQIVCVSYAVLAVLGCIPATCTLLGLSAISGTDIGLHLFIAFIAGTFGFVIGSEDRTTIGTTEIRGQHLDELPSHGK